MLPKPERALGGLECDSVDAAQDRGDSNDQRELAIHLTNNSWQEGGWQEDGNEHQSDTDDGPEKFIHCCNGRILRRLASLDVFRCPLDHHDGIIDDDSNGQHDRK